MTRQEAKELALKHCKPIHHSFESWVFPVIQNMAATDDLIRDLASVQSMQGHRGNQELEAGYVYAPYMPLFYMDFVYDSKWERFKRFIRGLFNLLFKRHRRTRRLYDPGGRDFADRYVRAGSAALM